MPISGSELYYSTVHVVTPLAIHHSSIRRPQSPSLKTHITFLDQFAISPYFRPFILPDTHDHDVRFDSFLRLYCVGVVLLDGYKRLDAANFTRPHPTHLFVHE